MLAGLVAVADDPPVSPVGLTFRRPDLAVLRMLCIGVGYADAIARDPCAGPAAGA